MSRFPVCVTQRASSADLKNTNKGIGGENFWFFNFFYHLVYKFLKFLLICLILVYFLFFNISSYTDYAFLLTVEIFFICDLEDQPRRVLKLYDVSTVTDLSTFSCLYHLCELQLVHLWDIFTTQTAQHIGKSGTKSVNYIEAA